MRHTINICDEPFDVDFLVLVTHKEFAGTLGGSNDDAQPPEAMEFETYDAVLIDKDGKALETPQWLLQLIYLELSQSDEVYDMVKEDA